MRQKKVINIIQDKNLGKSITDLVRISRLSRSAVRTAIAKLEGANRIYFKNIGMAKVYFLNNKKKKKNNLLTSKRVKGSRKRNKKRRSK
jgi:predicted transcriptional regulator